MRDACCLRRTRLQALILHLITLSCVAVLAVPAWAGSNVVFDPTGGNGANKGVTINASQFTWAPGNAVALGAITPGAGPTLGSTFELKYQAILGGINGTTQNGGGVSVFSQQSDGTPANGGEIVTGGPGGGATGREVVITADFRETLASINSAGGQNTLTFNLVPTGTNLVNIYDAPAGTALNFAGTGFQNGTLIMQGHVVQNGAEGSYASTFTTPTTGTGSPTSPVNFDQYSGDSAAQAFWGSTKTTSGTGSTFIPVVLDPTMTNSAFFPAGGPLAFQLTFPSVSTADPFNSVSPSKLFFGSATPPSIGAINGFSGTDIQFQVLAANDFIVPEPASIIQALAAITMIPTFLYVRRRRSRTTVV